MARELKRQGGKFRRFQIRDTRTKICNNKCTTASYLLQLRSRKREVAFKKVEIGMKIANVVEINEENRPYTRASRLQSLGGTNPITHINSFA